MYVNQSTLTWGIEFSVKVSYFIADLSLKLAFEVQVQSLVGICKLMGGFFLNVIVNTKVWCSFL